MQRLENKKHNLPINGLEHPNGERIVLLGYNEETGEAYSNDYFQGSHIGTTTYNSKSHAIETYRYLKSVGYKKSK